MRYKNQSHSYDDIKQLIEAAKKIQKLWRGYKARGQFMNEVNLMHHKIQVNKNKIATLDPKYWDGASDSIVHADDPQSEIES